MARQPIPSARRKPTFAFVTGWDLGHLGGVNQVVVNLMRQADLTDSYRSLSIVSDWEAKRPRLGRRNGRPTLRIAQRAPWIPGAALTSMIAYAITLPWKLLVFATVLRRLNIRVLNFHYPSLDAITWLLLRRLRIYSGKVILSLHGRDVRDSAQGTAIERWLWRWMMRNADSVVSCSRGLADDALKLYPSIGANSRVVYNGVDAQVLRDLPEADSALPSGDGPLIVNLGTYEHKKGQDILLRAFARVLVRLPTARLAIAGRTAEPAMLAKLNSLLDELKLGDRVLLHRDLSHAQAVSLLKRCDLFALPSRNEGFAIVLLEAGIMGKPVVATDICGVAELIANGDDGIIVPAEDVAQLADAICAQLSDASLARQQALKLQSKVATGFTWRQTWSQYQQLADASSEPS